MMAHKSDEAMRVAESGVEGGEHKGEDMMVTVTERAKEELKKALESANISEPEVGLRLAPTAPGQFGLVADGEREGDQVIEYEGSKVLLVGSELAEPLDGVTIDCQDTPEGARLVMSKE
jgi:Fe-S cluster assembly iron-binding protein IscA